MAAAAVAGRQPVVAPRFTDRDGDLAALTATLAVPGAVALVDGELGIGKSRLVAEYLATPQGQAARPVVACCPPFLQPQTLGPLADALRPAAEDIAALGLTSLAGALRPLFPEWSEVLPVAPEPAEDATAARSRLFRALAELLSRLGAGLLVLEDAHWADDTTLEFLLYLASRPPRSATTSAASPALLVTVRSEDVPAGPLLPRLARLASGGRGLRLTLGPLTRAGTTALIYSMLGTDWLTEDFTAFLHEQAGGVPLAVEESVRLLAARADLTLRDGHWVRRRLPQLAVPPSIRDSVQERSARLSPDAQQVLAAAAVLAEPAREDLIAVVAGLEANEAGKGISEALGSALLAEDESGLMSIRHPLACRVLYEAVPRPTRRPLHQRAGDTLTQSGNAASAATLARHFREAGDTPRWQTYAEQAADLALAVGDQAASATLLAGVVAGAELDPDELARLMDKIVLLALPDQSQLTALETTLRHTLDTAADLAPEVEARLRFQLGRLLLTLHQPDASRVELERAVDGLPAGSLQAARAMMLLGWPQGSDGAIAEHLQWLRRAEASAADVPPLERLRLTIDRTTALLLLGEESGWEQAAKLPWLPRAAGESLQVTRAHVNIGEAVMVWGRYAEARRLLKHAAELADRYGYAGMRAEATAVLAHVDWLTGNGDGLAERVATLRDNPEVRDVARMESGLVGGLLAAASGDRDRAMKLLDEVVADARRCGDVRYVMEPSAALARLHLAAGEVVEALQVTEEPMAVAARKGTWLWAADLVRARVAALVAAGCMAEATELADAFAAGMRGQRTPVLDAAELDCRAMLAASRGEHAEAAALFADAATAWSALPRPDESAQAQAQAQARSGQLAGDSPLPARGRPSYGDQLSPREREVVRLVAAGRSNREIAETLMLSRQTVAGHLHSAMRKLRVSSRTALAVTAVESQLL